jgi:hypothetical protein
VPLNFILDGTKFKVQAWANGRGCELEEFLLSLKDLSPEKWNRACSLIKRISDKGPPDNEEQCRKIGDDLYQVIVYRGVCLFWFYGEGNTIIYTHACLSGKSALKKEIAKAKLIQKQYWEVSANVSF